jgi:hypothetical protein
LKQATGSPQSSTLSLSAEKKNNTFKEKSTIENNIYQQPTTSISIIILTIKPDFLPTHSFTQELDVLYWCTH